MFEAADHCDARSKHGGAGAKHRGLPEEMLLKTPGAADLSISEVLTITQKICLAARRVCDTTTITAQIGTQEDNDVLQIWSVHRPTVEYGPCAPVHTFLCVFLMCVETVASWIRVTRNASVRGATPPSELKTQRTACQKT